MSNIPNKGLTDLDESRGFVRPLRNSYSHQRCGTVTTMTDTISEVYATDPKFYIESFCLNCGKHYLSDEFIWEGTDEFVGS